MIYDVTVRDKTHRIELTRQGAEWRCKLDGREMKLDVVATQSGTLSLLIDGKSYVVKLESTGPETNIVVGRQRFPVQVHDPRSLRSRRTTAGDGGGPRKITAPMPGKVVRILANAGTAVEAGQGVVVIEAMKMQNELKSPKKGIVSKLNVKEGVAVEAGQSLAEVE